MCDVYAFGAVMVVLFGEKVLWEGLSAFQIMCKITCENQFPSTKHLDNEIQAICNRCLIEQEKRSSSSEILLMLLQIEI